MVFAWRATRACTRSGNPYVYANDEPNMLTDPTGRSCFNPIVLAVIAVYGAADFGEVVATAAAAAIAGPLGLLLGLAVVAAAYGELLAVNSALDACGLSKYDIPLPQQ